MSDGERLERPARWVRWQGWQQRSDVQRWTYLVGAGFFAFFGVALMLVGAFGTHALGEGLLGGMFFILAVLIAVPWGHKPRRVDSV